MKSRSLFIILSLLVSIPVLAREFSYTYEGQTIIYTILDEEKKTVETKAATTHNSPGNSVVGDLILPEHPINANVTYTLTSIGKCGFMDCTGLSSVTIPNTVTTIDDNAFRDCTNLISVDIGNSVTSIGESAFSDCLGLTSVTIPNSVTSIKVAAFQGCSGLTSVIIPNSVRSIASYTFNCCYGLTSVTIPNSVTSIESCAFQNCTSLTMLTIPNSVTSIDFHAFFNCKKLSSVIIPVSVTSISMAFDGCINLKKSAYPSTLSSNPFPYGVAIQYPVYGVTYEDDCIWGPDKSALYFVSLNVEGEFVIPNSVSSICESAFENCVKLTSITIPEFVTTINYAAFRNCSELTYVAIGDAVTTIGNYAFYGCTRLTSLNIGNSVTTIGNYAFYECPELSSLTIPNSVTSIGRFNFVKSNFKSLTLGSGLTSIGENAFLNTTVAKAFWIGNNPPQGYDNVDATINYVRNDQYNFINKVIYPHLNSKFAIDGIIYVPVNLSERTCDIIDCTYDSHYSDIIIANKVANHGIEMSINNVGQYAFYGNQYIKSLSLNYFGNLRDAAFYGCTNIDKLNIQNTIREIGSSAFAECSNITNISIPNSVTAIGDYAFSGCTSLSNVTFEDGNNTIESESDNLTLGSNGAKALFADCPLDEVYIGRRLYYKTNASDGYSPFYRNTTLRSVVISDTETIIYNNEFNGCSNIKSLRIGNSVTEIGDYAFSGCYNVTQLYSHSITPPVCGNLALEDINKWECTLFVPGGSSNSYRVAPQWKDFLLIKDMDTIPVDEILLNYSEVEMLVGTSLQLTAEVTPLNATNKVIAWASSNPNCVMVSENGMLEAISIGSATITACSADGNTETECVVTVTDNSGIEGIYDSDIKNLEVYNLSGIRITSSLKDLPTGIYIVKECGNVSKIAISR